MKLFGWRKKKFGKDKLITVGELCSIPGVDEQTVAAFFASTHDASRRLPLLIAANIANRFQDELTRPGEIRHDRLVEIRGALRALRLFATCYHNGIEEWLSKGGRGDA